MVQVSTCPVETLHADYIDGHSPTVLKCLAVRAMQVANVFGFET